MKLKNINNLKKVFIVMLGIVVLSCADPDLKPIVTFDDAGHGAYPRLLEENGSKDMDLFDLSSFAYSYSVEFVDDAKGGNVATFRLDVDYVGSDGTNKSAEGFMEYTAANFTSSAEGYKAVENISFTTADFLSALSMVEADVNQADKFIVKGQIITNSGAIHNGANSSSTVEGAAFRGWFDITFKVVCPSDLGGTHTVVSTVGWCGNTVSGGSTTWVADPDVNGKYTVTAPYLDGDYSFGAYDACYGDGATFGSAGFGPQGTLSINDLCNGLSWGGASQWGEIYTFNSVSVSGSLLILDWVNDYGESGVTTLEREGGANWPPLVDGD